VQQGEATKVDAPADLVRDSELFGSRRFPVSISIFLAVATALVIVVSLTIASALQFQRERENFDTTSLTLATSIMDRLSPVIAETIENDFPNLLTLLFSQIGDRLPIVGLRVIDSGGQVMAAGGSTDFLGEIDEVLTALQTDALYVVKGGMLVEASRNVELPNGGKIVLQVSVSTDQFESLSEDLPNIIWQGALLALGGAAIALILARFITGPLLQLVSASRRISSGDLDFSTASGRKDEIGILANAFDDMRRELQLAGVRISDSQNRLEATNKRLATEIDIRSLAEGETLEHAERARALAQIGRTVSSATELDEMYVTLVELVGETIPHDRAAIVQVDERGSEASYVYVHGAAVPERSTGDVVPITGTLLEQVIKTREPGQVDGASVDPDIGSELQGPGSRSGMKSLAVAPFYREGLVFGAISLSSARANAFSDSDLELLDQIARQVGGTIGAAQISLKLRAASEQRILDLEELDRLRVQFIQMVTHELRTPLAAALVSQGLLAELPNDDHGNSARQRLISNMGRGLKRLNSLVSDILELTVAKSGDGRIAVAPTDIENVIRASIDVVSPLLEVRSQEILFESSKSPIRLDIERQKIELVVINLLSNAQKYSPPESTIHVTVVETDESVRVEVAGEGPPVLAEDREHLFEAFFRGSDGNTRRASGKGLGLAIANALIELHNGTIGYDPEGIHGSTFYFTLPKG